MPTIIAWRRPLALAAAFTLCLAGSTAAAGSRRASAAQPGCGQTITADTHLHADLIDCPASGLVVGADHVTLDLNGHTIAGDGSANPEDTPDVGVDLGSHSDVTVRNGSVRGFDHGVAAAGGDRVAITDVAADDNTLSGVLLQGGDRDALIHVEAMRNGRRGIRLEDVADSRIADSRVGANTFNQIAVFGGDRDRFDHDVITDAPTEAGLRVADASGDVIDHLTVLRDSAGIIVGGERNLVSHNVLRYDGDAVIVDGANNRVAYNHISDLLHFGSGEDAICGIGVSFEGGIGNTAEHNLIERTCNYGVRADGYSDEGIRDTVIRDNIIRYAPTFGIAVNAEDAGLVINTLVERNIVLHSGDDGIHAASPATTITANHADFNGGYGIAAVSGVTDSGGNHARGNANSPQCLNVFCAP
jgi:Right handed beta helix region